MIELKKVKQGFVVLQGLVFFFLVGCASYQGKVSAVRDLIRQGQFTEACEKLKPLAETEDRDQLVYLLDYGMALYLSGQYKQSVDVFLKADKIAEIQDYHSITNVTSSLVLNAEQVQYKGDNYEKVLINAYLALNFLNMGDFENAMVQVRRLNEKLYKMKYEGGKNYDQNIFAKYISAVLWEADKNWDNAYITYEESYKLDPSIPYIKEDLIRLAKKSDRRDTYEKWKKQFSDIKEDPQWYDKKLGELVVIYEQGWAPTKQPRPESPRFPMLVPSYSNIQSVKVRVGSHIESSLPLFNLGQVAIQTLNEDYAAIVGGRVAGVVAKAVVADQIRQKNEALGNIAWIVTNVMDRADLRQWSTLPNSIHIVRILLPAGEYDVDVNGADYHGSAAGGKTFNKVKIESGKKKFLTWRSLL